MQQRHINNNEGQRKPFNLNINYCDKNDTNYTEKLNWKLFWHRKGTVKSTFYESYNMYRMRRRNYRFGMPNNYCCTDAWITHCSVAGVDDWTVKEDRTTKLSCYVCVSFYAFCKFWFSGMFGQKKLTRIVQNKRFWKINKVTLHFSSCDGKLRENLK